MPEDQLDKMLGNLADAGKIGKDDTSQTAVPLALEFTKIAEAVMAQPHLRMGWLRRGDLLKIQFSELAGQGQEIQQGDFVVVKQARRLISYPSSLIPATLMYLAGDCLPEELKQRMITLSGSVVGGGSTLASSTILAGSPLELRKPEAKSQVIHTLPIISVELHRKGHSGEYNTLSLADIKAASLQLKESDILRRVDMLMQQIDGLTRRTRDEQKSSGTIIPAREGDLVDFINNGRKGNIDAVSIYSKTGQRVYTIRRINTELPGEQIYNIETFTGVDRGKYIESIDKYNPWDIAQERYIHNISNEGIDGSMCYIVQGWQVRGLNLNNGPCIMVGPEGEVDIDFPDYLEPDPIRAQGIIRNEIKANLERQELKVAIGKRRYKMPVCPDITAMEKVVGRILSGQYSISTIGTLSDY